MSFSVVASAAPVFTVSPPTNLGGGYYSWTVSVDAADASNAALAVAVTISGSIGQVPLTNAAAIAANGGANVDLTSRVPSALALDGGYAALANLDSVFDNSVLSVALPPYGGATGGGVGNGSFRFSAGTPAGTMVLTAPLARVVGLSGVTLSGIVARNGVDYPVEVVLAPQVSTGPTAFLVGIGVLLQFLGVGRGLRRSAASAAREVSCTESV